jgi:hypothetical protein
VSFVEDRTRFFSDFAVAATLQGVAVTSGVIFDADYIEPLGNYVEGREPVALANAEEVPLAAHGQLLVITANAALGVPGGTYTVRGVKPDGTGIVVLKLQE